jgi:hypothetical protein
MTNKPLIITDGRIEQIDEVDALPQYSHLKTGWNVDAIDNIVSVTINESTRTVTVTPIGDDATYWIAGIQYTFNTPQDVTFTNNSGMWYIAFNGATLQAIQTEWTFNDTLATVLSLYWNSTDNELILYAPELHSWDTSDRMHDYFHETRGTQWAWGLGLEIVSGNTTVNLAQGELHDEDIEAIVTDDAGSGFWDQILTPLTAPVMYQSGATGEWKRTLASSNTAYISSNIPQINQFTDNAWTLVPVGVAQHFAYWVVGSTSSPPVYLIPGQADDGTLADARANNTWSDLSFGSLPTLEHKVLARIIMQRSADSPFYTIEEYTDYRSFADEP